MEVIVHYPAKPEGINALHGKVAVVHTQAIARTIDNLSCPKEQKLQLFKEIAQSLADKQQHR